MNPQVVWHVWRRIMREPQLQQALFAHGDQPVDIDHFGLNQDECEAAYAYARQSDRAKWFVTNYRFRLANSFLNALETGAPLTLRALLGQGVDIQALSHAFLDQHAWKDYGPYVHAYCRDALVFLSKHPDVANIAGLADLIEFERETVTWLIQLSALPSLSDQGALAAGMIERTPFALYHRCGVRLSQWLRDKTSLGKVPLEAGVEHYFVYLLDTRSTVRFMRVPVRAAGIYESLDEACALTALRGLLQQRGHAEHTDQDDDCLAMLTRCRAIRLGTGVVAV